MLTGIYFDVNTVAYYLNSLKENISPIKLQKALYFLFAYHGAIYSHEQGEGISEGTDLIPKYLFNARFEAWKFGPVIREVYFKDRDDEYSDHFKIKEAVALIEREPEIKKFIDDLFSQIDAVSDFQLVERSHQDESWKTAYQKAQSTEMDNDLIIEEYKKRYVGNVD